MMIYSGISNEDGTATGIACIINKRVAQNIIHWKEYSERIIKIELQIAPSTLHSFIAVD